LGRPLKVQPVFIDDGKIILASTTAAVDENRHLMLVGSLYSKGIGLCKVF
jgi:hypothetical protein